MNLFCISSETIHISFGNVYKSNSGYSKLLRIKVQFLIEVLKDLTDSNKVEVHDDHEMSFFSSMMQWVLIKKKCPNMNRTCYECA